MGIALNLQIAFDRMAIFTMLTLPIHEYGRSFPSSDISIFFHFDMFSSKIFQFFFFKDLKFLSYKSFTCLVRIIPKCLFVLFEAIVKDIVFVISFSEIG